MGKKSNCIIFFTVFSVPIIIIALVLTGIITIDTRSHHSDHPTKPQPKPPLDFVSNASQFLRSNGFNFISTLLHFSPDIFISPPQTTLFAIPDSVISNLSIPPYITIQLITYHISPSKLTIQDLFNKPLNTCLSTKFQQQKISITKQDPINRLLEINNVLITRPDMFLHESIAIHGVNGTFASFKSRLEINKLPVCNTNNSDHDEQVTLDLMKYKKGEWKTVVKFLSLSGYTPFVFGLYNVLDEIVKDHPDLYSMTIFAPPVIEVLQMPKLVLHKFIKAHIIPKKYSYKHLASMITKGLPIKTLCPGKEIEISKTVSFSDQLLLINRVEMTSPDLLSSRSFVVHGIARALETDGVTSHVSV